MLIDYQNEYRNNLNSDMRCRDAYQQPLDQLSAVYPDVGKSHYSASPATLISGRRKLTLPWNSWREKKQRLQARQTPQERLRIHGGTACRNRPRSEKMDEFAQRAARRKPE